MTQDSPSPVGPPAPADRSRRLIGLVGGLLLIGTVLAVFALTIARGSPGPSARIGELAPAFSLERLDGGRLSLEELRGRPVVLNFWASWCIPCREEAPLLTKLAADYSDRGLMVVGVVYQDTAANAIDFMRRYGQTYPGLLDPTGRTALDYGVLGIPETYFIDATGAVRWRQIGQIVPADLQSSVAKILP